MTDNLAKRAKQHLANRHLANRLLANSFLTETFFVKQFEMSVGKVVFNEMTRARLNTGNQSFVSSISFQEENTKLASTIEIRPECACVFVTGMRLLFHVT
jgi:hypothetical protein